MTVTEADRITTVDGATKLAAEVRSAYRTFEQDTAPVRALRGVDLESGTASSSP